MHVAEHEIDTLCAIEPKFDSSGASSHKWLLLPLILYVLERTSRCLRSQQPVELERVFKHPSDVVELRFTKPNLRMAEPGQYVFVNVPEIAKFQWHPFTLTSAPADEYLSVHVRVAGDWTKVTNEQSNIP